MSMKAATFIGHPQEVAALEERCASPDSELLAIYERCRVGEAVLLTRIANGKPVVSFAASANLARSAIWRFDARRSRLAAGI